MQIVRHGKNRRLTQHLLNFESQGTLTLNLDLRFENIKIDALKIDVLWAKFIAGNE